MQDSTDFDRDSTRVREIMAHHETVDGVWRLWRFIFQHLCEFHDAEVPEYDTMDDVEMDYARDHFLQDNPEHIVVSRVSAERFMLDTLFHSERSFAQLRVQREPNESLDVTVSQPNGTVQTWTLHGFGTPGEIDAIVEELYEALASHTTEEWRQYVAERTKQLNETLNDPDTSKRLADVVRGMMDVFFDREKDTYCRFFIQHHGPADITGTVKYGDARCWFGLTECTETRRVFTKVRYCDHHPENIEDEPEVVCIVTDPDRRVPSHPIALLILDYLGARF